MIGQNSLAPCKYKTLVDFCTSEIPKNDEGFRVVKAEVQQYSEIIRQYKGRMDKEFLKKIPSMFEKQNEILTEVEAQ